MSDFPYIGNGLQTFQPQPRVWTWLALLLVALAVFLTVLVKSHGLVKHGFSFGFIAWCGGRRVSLHVRTEMEIAHEDEENEAEDEKEGVKKEANLMQKKKGHRRSKSYPALDGLLRRDSSFSCLLGTKMFLCIEKSSNFHSSRSNPSLCFSPTHEIPNLPLIKQEVSQIYPDDSVKPQRTPWPSLETPVKSSICRGRDLCQLSSFLLQFPTFEQQFGFDRTPPWEKPSLPCPPPLFSSLLKISVSQRKLLNFFKILVNPVASLALTPPENQASIGLTEGEILIWDIEKAMAVSKAVSLAGSPVSALLRDKEEKRRIFSVKMGIVEQWDERISTQPVFSWALSASHRDGAITSIISKWGQELICSNNSISCKLDLRMPKHKPAEVFMNGKMLLDEHSVLDVLDSLLFLLPHHDEDEEDFTCETQEQNKAFAVPGESGSFLSRCVDAVRGRSFEHRCSSGCN